MKQMEATQASRHPSQCPPPLLYIWGGEMVGAGVLHEPGQTDVGDVECALRAGNVEGGMNGFDLFLNQVWQIQGQAQGHMLAASQGTLSRGDAAAFLLLHTCALTVNSCRMTHSCPVHAQPCTPCANTSIRAALTALSLLCACVRATTAMHTRARTPTHPPTHPNTASFLAKLQRRSPYVCPRRHK